MRHRTSSIRTLCDGARVAPAVTPATAVLVSALCRNSGLLSAEIQDTVVCSRQRFRTQHLSSAIIITHTPHGAFVFPR